MVLTKDKERIKREEGRTIGAVKELQNLLGLTGLHRMEAYDISNTNGFESVGSMVVYEKGKPKRNDYRKFKIKGVKGANDYASMNDSEAFRLITRIQDEAHRFAITFHRQLRSQGQVHSILDDIPGVGPARRKDLMKHFANIEAIKNATVEELKSLPSMNEKSAKDVYDFFH